MWPNTYTSIPGVPIRHSFFFLGFLLFLLVEDQQFLFQTRPLVSYCCALVLFLLRFGVGRFWLCFSTSSLRHVLVETKKRHRMEVQVLYMYILNIPFTHLNFGANNYPNRKEFIKISQQFTTGHGAPLEKVDHANEAWKKHLQTDALGWVRDWNLFHTKTKMAGLFND